MDPARRRGGIRFWACSVNRFERVSARYDRCERLLRHSIELVAVEDPIGAQYHRLIKVLEQQIEGQSLGFLKELLDWAKQLRFHLLTEPLPTAHVGSIRRIADWLENERPRAAPTADTTALWQAVIANAGFLAKNDPAVSRIILDSCFEAGVENCVVLAHSEAAADALDAWLADYCIRVVSPSDYLHDAMDADITYAVGPPALFRSAIYSVPATDELTYLFPSWFPYPEIPPTPLAGFAEFPMVPRARRFTAGERIDVGTTEAPELPRSAFLPTPEVAAPSALDVPARRVSLAGAMETFISDVDRVRRLDPSKQPSDRIAWIDPTAISVGTHLVLHCEGSRDAAHYRAALALFADGGVDAELSQNSWKSVLRDRIAHEGLPATIERCRAIGIESCEELPRWAGPSCVGPERDRDLRALLHWLLNDPHTALKHATKLRGYHSWVAARSWKTLRRALDGVNMDVLASRGHFFLDSELDGVPDTIVTRVLSVEPDWESVDSGLILRPRSVDTPGHLVTSHAMIVD